MVSPAIFYKSLNVFDLGAGVKDICAYVFYTSSISFLSKGICYSCFFRASKFYSAFWSFYNDCAGFSSLFAPAKAPKNFPVGFAKIYFVGLLTISIAGPDSSLLFCYDATN